MHSSADVGEEMMRVHNSVIHPWDYIVTPFPVADHVYYVGNRWVGSYLLDSGEGLILIDCAMPQTLYLLLDGIRYQQYHQQYRPRRSYRCIQQ